MALTDEKKIEIMRSYHSKVLLEHTTLQQAANYFKDEPTSIKASIIQNVRGEADANRTNATEANAKADELDSLADELEALG